MKKRRNFILFFSILFLGLIFISAAKALEPDPLPNPILGESCGLDIVLVMDSSGSINGSNLEKEKDAFKTFIDAFLPETPTRFAFVDFDSTARGMQDFTDNVTLLKNAIDSITYENGGTNWKDAFQKANDYINSVNNRIDHADLIVFSSDGNPTWPYGNGIVDHDFPLNPLDLNEAIEAANNVKANGARIFAMGIGVDINISNLIKVSGSNVNTGGLSTDIITTDFSNMSDELSAYSELFCENNIFPNPPLSESCGLDITLVLDMSSSIDWYFELYDMVSAFNNFVDAFLPATPTKISVIHFSDLGVIKIYPSNNIIEIKSAISDRDEENCTNWQSPLQKVQEIPDERSTIPNLVVFASDGNPNMPLDNCESVYSVADLDLAVIEANKIKFDGTRILVLGIGDMLKEDYLKEISGPNLNTGNLDVDVITTNFSDLASDLADYAKILCSNKILVQVKIDNDNDGVYELDGSFQDSDLLNWNFVGAGKTSLTNNVGYSEIQANLAGTYSLIETIKPGYVLDDIQCVKNSNPIGIFDGIDTIDNLQLLDGEIIFCVFFNRNSTISGSSCSQYRTQLQCENFNVDLAKESVKFWRDDDKTCPDIIGNLAGCDIFLTNCSCVWDIQLNKCRTKVNVSTKNCLLFDVGMCVYESETVINCSQGPSFEVMKGDWIWNPVNNNTDCDSTTGVGCFNELGTSYFDPFSDYKICLSPKVVPCLTELAFFGFFQFSFVILLISIIYFFLNFKKEIIFFRKRD